MFHNLLAHIGLHTLDQIKYSMDNIARELCQIIMNFNIDNNNSILISTCII